MGFRPRTLIAGLAVALIAVVLVVGVSGYWGEVQARLGEHGASAGVVDLHDVDQLKAAFNADAGTPRLVVLFSPT